MIQLVQTALSDELLQYPNGIAFSKLKRGWWTEFKAVHRYFCDKVSAAVTIGGSCSAPAVPCIPGPASDSMLSQWVWVFL